MPRYALWSWFFADLEFALRGIKDHFRDQLAQEDSALRRLYPFARIPRIMFGVFSCPRSQDQRKSLLEELLARELRKSDHPRFYRNAIKEFRVMDHEVDPEDAHDGSPLIGYPPIGVNAVGKKRLVPGGAEVMNRIGVSGPVGVFNPTFAVRFEKRLILLL